MPVTGDNEANPWPTEASGRQLPPGDHGHAGAPATRRRAEFSAADRAFLLDLARRTLQQVVLRRPLPEIHPSGLAPHLAAIRSCFITLTEHETLRGCVGHLVAREPLYRAVMENTRNAALNDHRFPPVRPEETERLEIEISVLTEPRRLTFTSPVELLSQLHPGQDGVVLRIGHCTATFLPQVWAEIPHKVRFLDQLAEKAGCAPERWRQADAAVSVYQAEAFREPAP